MAAKQEIRTSNEADFEVSPDAPYGRNNIGVPWADQNHCGEGGAVKHREQTGRVGKSEVGGGLGLKAELDNRDQLRAPR